MVILDPPYGMGMGVFGLDFYIQIIIWISIN